MKPATSERNRTPSSTALLSFCSGPVTAGEKIEHGHACSPTSRFTLSAAPMLAASSTARACTTTGPGGGLMLWVQLVVPVARSQVAPPSVETSTAATTPPESAAVPETTTPPPGTLAPSGGAMMVAVGAVASSGPPATRLAWRLPGCAPMSDSRLTVACCMSAFSGGAGPRSWTASRPQVHWTVPAPKTRAPLGAR